MVAQCVIDEYIRAKDTVADKLDNVLKQWCADNSVNYQKLIVDYQSPINELIDYFYDKKWEADKQGCSLELMEKLENQINWLNTYKQLQELSL